MTKKKWQIVRRKTWIIRSKGERRKQELSKKKGYQIVLVKQEKTEKNRSEMAEKRKKTKDREKTYSSKLK